VQARIDAEAKRLKAAGDERTMEQLRCDVSLQLLTHGVLPGEEPAAWSVAVLVPLSTVEGGDLEVAEIPSWGPVLPSTARDLAAQARTFTQVAVDEDGHVLAVSDPQPVPTALQGLAAAARKRPVVRDLGSASYRVPSRLRRFLEARDRTCVFPGCTRPAAVTDKDHALPWPLGPTSPENLHCLCRRHHRAKQSPVFTVHRLPDGTTLWITRGQWWSTRKPQSY
ncbi:MAG: HNH endonuclease signature motif containing protein, partial [Nocardioidaceae bacterium]